MKIYNNNNISTFFDNAAVSNDFQINQLLTQLRQIFIINTQPTEYDIFNLDNQLVNTENDLKCIVFSKIKQINLGLPFEVHSEESDKIQITNDYCTNLTNIGDISNQTTSTRQTDLTVTIEPQENPAININKAYSRNGKHLDIELKYIRSGFSSAYLKDIRRDLCKLKYLVDPNVDHYAINDHGINEFGIFFLGFRKKSVLEAYLDAGLRQRINNFNQLDNVAILLFFREDI